MKSCCSAVVNNYTVSVIMFLDIDQCLKLWCIYLYRRQKGWIRGRPRKRPFINKQWTGVGILRSLNSDKQREVNEPQFIIRQLHAVAARTNIMCDSWNKRIPHPRWPGSSLHMETDINPTSRLCSCHWSPHSRSLRY